MAEVGVRDAVGAAHGCASDTGHHIPSITKKADAAAGNRTAAEVGARDAVGAERAAQHRRNDGPQLGLQHSAAAAAQDGSPAVAREGRQRRAPRRIPCLSGPVGSLQHFLHTR